MKKCLKIFLKVTYNNLGFVQETMIPFSIVSFLIKCSQSCPENLKKNSIKVTLIEVYDCNDKKMTLKVKV